MPPPASTTGPNPFLDPRASRTTLPPIVLSCAHCSRILSDSSHFVCADRRSATVTLAEVVSVGMDEGLQTAAEGQWDEFCNYKVLRCEGCGMEVGRRYMAVMGGLERLQGKYTLSIPALTFYHVGTKTPSLPVAESREILDLIKPAPDQIAETLAQVMMMCIALREEQEGIMQVLRRVGGRCGVDVDAEGEDGGEVGMVGGQVDAELKTRVEKVEHKLSTFRDGIMSDVESMLQTLRRDLQDTIAPRSRPSSHRPDSDKEDEPVRKRQRKVTRNSLGDDVELVSLPYGNASKAEVEKKKRLARLSGSPRITVRKEGVNGVESNGLQQQPPNTPTKTVVVPERNGESYHKATAAEEESSRQLEAESLQKDKDGPWIIPNSEDEQSSQALSTQNSLTSIKEARKVKVEVGKEKERDNEAKTKSTRKVAEKRRASGRISRGGK